MKVYEILCNRRMLKICIEYKKNDEMLGMMKIERSLIYSIRKGKLNIPGI